MNRDVLSNLSDPSALGFKASIVHGSFAGGLVSFILSEGTLARRLVRAGGCIVFSVYGTEGVLELAKDYIVASPATERLGGLVLGILGIYVAELGIQIVSKLRDKTDQISDKIIEKI